MRDRANVLYLFHNVKTSSRQGGKLFRLNAACINEAAFMEQPSPIHPRRHLQIMGGDDRCDGIAAADLHHHVKHKIGRLGIKIAGGLIRQKKLRLVGKRTRNGHTLLLAAGQPCWTVARPVAQAHALEELERMGLGRLGPLPRDHLRDHDVLNRVKFREQMVELIDKADLVAADQRAFLIGKALPRTASDVNVALAGEFQEAANVQERGLA